VWSGGIMALQAWRAVNMGGHLHEACEIGESHPYSQ
jgi:hypothetical protein